MAHQSVHEHLGPTALALDVDSEGESDSTLGLSLVSETSSVRSSLFEAVEENGRTYHKYKEGNYYLPNDETEQSRLNLQHHLFMLTFDGRLSLAPVGNPQSVLDIGTGTGIWAIEYALQNPAAVVIGSDLSAIQPDFVPPNCRFEVDDAQDEWTYAQLFSYIHGRALFSCFKDPRTVFRQAFAALTPGGYFEMQEIFFKPHSIDGTVEGTKLQAWNAKLIEGARILGGKDWWCTPNYAEWFSEVGFEDVVEQQFAWPSNPWPKGEKQKELGRTMLKDSLEGLSAISIAILTRAFGMTAAEVEEYLVDVQKDMNDKSIHTYYPIYVVYGRKPLPVEAEA